MRDDDIIEALKFCSDNDWQCDEACPLYGCCSKYLMASRALAIINRQKAEINALRKRIVFWRADLGYRPEEIRADAIKEFADELKNRIQRAIDNYMYNMPNGYIMAEDVPLEIDELVTEMTEGKNNA